MVKPLEKKLMDEGRENLMCGKDGGLPLIKKL
jgi:hypothetical protein